MGEVCDAETLVSGMISVARLGEWAPNSSRSFVFEEPAIIPP